MAEIKRPLLLALGSLDRRVSAEGVDSLVKAARPASVKVETMSWSNEGHDFFITDNHAGLFRRIETFLARELVPEPAPERPP